ncbi:RsmD family RNA methyltransferase [Yaniella halotolerans]|uniref:RsmD family RNA methyltransferase n=1 Tax=Yaniella halotolerans TaxID=225453 RepID=UPI0003B5E95D|nr:RsmD family RNA methyltransferase [Yaniella halotolerans]
MSKIVAGQAGGLPLKAVPGTSTRPTTERAKEAIFSWLESRDWLENNAVLDLYTGSGGLAVEAASRGAASVIGVEAARKPAQIAEHNAQIINEALGRDVVVIKQLPVQRFLGSTEPSSWDVVIADPPYDIEADELVATISQVFQVLMDDGLFVLETAYKSAEPAWPEGVYVVDARRYGEAMVYFVRRNGY